jgi:hypothetical protein
MFREICKFIEDRTGFKPPMLQIGHRAQGAPVRCVLVQETGGGETNFYCPDMANVLIQVISRAKTYFEARDDIYTVYETLHGTSGWNMPNFTGTGPDYLAMTVEALAVPQYLGEGENREHEFSVNFIFRMEQGSC